MNEMKWVARCVMRVNRFTAGLNQKEILRTIMKWSPCYTNNKAFLCIFLPVLLVSPSKFALENCCLLSFIVANCVERWAIMSGVAWCGFEQGSGGVNSSMSEERRFSPLHSSHMLCEWEPIIYWGFIFPPLHRSTRNQRRDVRGN